MDLKGTTNREWRKLHHEELLELYSSPNEVEEEEIGRACRRSGEDERV
jgi:hypothetical protein